MFPARGSCESGVPEPADAPSDAKPSNVGQAPGHNVLNAILAAMAPDSLVALHPHLEVVQLPARFQLAQQGRVAEWVYFPERGVAIVMGGVEPVRQGVGIFGPEGAGPLDFLFGPSVPSKLTVMLLGGSGLRIRADALRSFLASCPEMMALLLGFFHAWYVDVMEGSIAKSSLGVDRRLARFLLMLSDRMGGEPVHVTHDLLAQMLATSRSGVTIALNALAASGLISAARGRIAIRDRSAMLSLIAPLRLLLEPGGEAPSGVPSAVLPDRGYLLPSAATRRVS